MSCASSDYIDDKYKEMGRKLGRFIGEYNHTLVFGSSQRGIMGAVYRKTKEYGGKVISIIPEHSYGVLEKVECDKLIEVKQDTDQFDMLVKNNDVTIVLPGSVGMLTELCLSIHYNRFLKSKKKVIIVNQYGFFDEILETFNKMIKENFMYDISDDLYIVVDNIDKAIDILKK